MFFLVSLYSLFFFVELFHNFCANTAIAANAKSHAVYHAAKSTKSSQVKVGFRLNKRFKPAFAKFDYSHSWGTMVFYDGVHYIGEFSSVIPSNIYLRTTSLRAPPVV